MESSDERLGAVGEEAVAALRWISANTTGLPADFPNGSVRLRQVANRANEALRDIEHLRSKVDEPVLQEETGTRELLARWLYYCYTGQLAVRDKGAWSWDGESDEVRARWLYDAGALLAAISRPSGDGERGALRELLAVEVECPRCAGTGELESSDSTEDGWWDCGSRASAS